MTREEFDIITKGLGLTREWMRGYFKNKDGGTISDRTISYWLPGGSGHKATVPADIANQILRIEEFIYDTIAKILEEIPGEADEIGKPGFLSVAALVEFKSDNDMWKVMPEFHPLPRQAWTMVNAEIRRAAIDAGIPCPAVTMDVDNYIKYLDGQPDSFAARTEWAIMWMESGRLNY